MASLLLLSWLEMLRHPIVQAIQVNASADRIALISFGMV
jgi:hypothetical protein